MAGQVWAVNSLGVSVAAEDITSGNGLHVQPTTKQCVAYGGTTTGEIPLTLRRNYDRLQWFIGENHG